MTDWAVRVGYCAADMSGRSTSSAKKGCHVGEPSTVKLQFGHAGAALIDLGFADCELRKGLIYKGSLRVDKTPKAGVAGSIPAGRAISGKAFSGFPFFSDCVFAAKCSSRLGGLAPCCALICVLAAP